MNMQNRVHNPNRYDEIDYRFLGRSGLKIPPIGLGCWHNFGDHVSIDHCREIIHAAFDRGITHFDLANNYGPPPGTAEEKVGPLLAELPRHEIVVTTKAGYNMWTGPYGEWGSRKHILDSVDQSLKRLGLDHVDIFYHHRPDPKTPLDETMDALDYIVQSGRAMYVGISNYSASEMKAATATSKRRLIVNQCRLNILERSIDAALIEEAAASGVGLVAFSPLAQGRLTNRYFDGIPGDARAGRWTWDSGSLKSGQISEPMVLISRKLDEIASARGQSLAQMALTWVLQYGGQGSITACVTSVSSVPQLTELLQAASAPALTPDELRSIEAIVADTKDGGS
jgi:L-glyceraldehyde 3-phosphate reductase